MWFIKCILLSFSVQLTLSIEDTYRAAVVEFGVTRTANIEDDFQSSKLRYIQLIQEASEQDADIIVFPESTLNYGFTTNREQILNYAYYLPQANTIAPCDDNSYAQALIDLSCAARHNNVYVVINLSEKYPCSGVSDDERPCHPDGHYLFNSNLVFDRSGRVVSTYRKTHLFGEAAFNTTVTPEYATFTTDFGVEFGHLICFDLQFYLPAQELLRRGVRNFLVPLMWYSELPFLTAVQYYEAWGLSSGSNILAAGASNPLSGSAGSGIFSGKSGARASIMSGDVITRLLVADLYKDPTKDERAAVSNASISQNPSRIGMLRDHLDFYTVEFLDLERADPYQTTVCHEQLCCDFHIKTSLQGEKVSPHYEYALVAFSGARTYSGLASGGVQNCGVVACTARDRAECGLRFTESTTYNRYVTFEEITVIGNFSAENSAQYPTSLKGDFLPLSLQDYSIYSWNVGNSRYLNVTLTEKQDDLLAFGVFGRDFNMDDEIVFDTDDNLDQTNNGDVLNYMWIPLFIAVIYFLEMM